jgi:hypothetical protein
MKPHCHDLASVRLQDADHERPVPVGQVLVIRPRGTAAARRVRGTRNGEWVPPLKLRPVVSGLALIVSAVMGVGVTLYTAVPTVVRGAAGCALGCRARQRAALPERGDYQVVSHRRGYIVRPVVSVPAGSADTVSYPAAG